MQVDNPRRRAFSQPQGLFELDINALLIQCIKKSLNTENNSRFRANNQPGPNIFFQIIFNFLTVKKVTTFYGLESSKILERICKR